MNYFNDLLKNDPDGIAIGKQYFRSRGIRDDIIEKFNLGYACSDPDIDLRRVHGYDVQGEAGNAFTFIGTPALELRPWRHLAVEGSARYQWHHFNYRYHQHTSLDSWEWAVGLKLCL